MNGSSQSKFEVYRMERNERLQEREEQVDSKTLIVKRMNFMFDGCESQILNITDITAYIKL